jgi:hypothetical protein
MQIRRTVGAAVVVAASVAGCSSDSDNDSGGESGGDASIVVEFPEALPGDVIALRSGGGDSNVVEWIDRRAGTIRSLDLAAGDPSEDDVVTLASIEVGIEGEQRGLLGHTVIDSVRYAAWTDPDTEHLMVGALGAAGLDDSPAPIDRIVWDGGGTAGGAVGGHLEATADGALILGIGQLTDWAKEHGSGAILRLDPSGPPDQDPEVLSDGYINPFAFAVVGDQLWVADNAVGDDTERIGAIDLEPGSDRSDRADLDATGSAPRAPSAIIALPDGDVAVCGFLDGQLRRWTLDPPGYGDELGPCLTGAVVLPDGTIVTATADGLVTIGP